MYLHSILIVGGSAQTQEEKLGQILHHLGFSKTTNLVNNPNIVLIASGQDKLSIGIEQIRQLRSALIIKSINKLPKVALVSQAEMVTVEAQNALLKTLEEPPENTYLILTAKNTNSLLPTIVSRCQIIELAGGPESVVSPEEIKKLSATLELMEKRSITGGFAWAQETATDRKSALETIDKLIIAGRHLLLTGKIDPMTLRRLFEAKKYLSANTNTRLTLENLFLN